MLGSFGTHERWVDDLGTLIESIYEKSHRHSMLVAFFLEFFKRCFVNHSATICFEGVTPSRQQP